MKAKITIFALVIVSVISFAAFTHAAGLSVVTGQNFNVNTSVLNIASHISNSGTLRLSSGTIKLGGDWLNTGAFNSDTSGTVVFTGIGQSTITGANTFANFTCTQPGKQLNFEAGETQTIAGAWTLTGASGNLISLGSTVAGTRWKVNPQGARNISFVDVQDSNNLSPAIIDPANSIDSGNNHNWFSVTAVEIVSFTAKEGEQGAVILSWETATEIDNAGFNIYRSKRSDGAYKKVNGKLIPAQGGGSLGASYSYEETPGKGTFRYKLEDADTNGVSTMHGPVKVRVRSAEGEARRR